MGELGVEHFLFLSAALFIIGMMGVLIRRNLIIILMCVEMMETAVNISLVAFGWENNSLGGRAFVLFTVAVAAGGVGVGAGVLLCIDAAGAFG